MSKMDGLRAMREARYAQAAAGAAKPATRPKATPTVKQAATPEAAEPVAADDGAEGLCGHKGMGGKPCTREQGHAAKSHRYS